MKLYDVPIYFVKIPKLNDKLLIRNNHTSVTSSLLDSLTVFEIYITAEE